MTEFARPRLADQPWFSDLLEMHGFRRSATDAFTNGRATLRLTGSVIQAMPGDGSRAWRTDIGEASPETVRQLLATVLAAPAFLAQADLDRRSARQHQAEASLRVLAEAVREQPESPGGMQLRRLLWSMFNQHHVVNLWDLANTLDRRHGEAAGVVLGAFLDGLVSESALRWALNDSGEMARWDTVQPEDTDLTELREAGAVVRRLLRRGPPGEATGGLVRLDGLLDEAARELSRLERRHPAGRGE